MVNQISKFSRRKFFNVLGQSFFVNWIAMECLTDQLFPVHSEILSQNIRNGILNLKLETAFPEELYKFYKDIIGFPCTFKKRNLILKTGSSIIEFNPTSNGPKPLYHIAWAIPSNKFEGAKQWLSSKVNLLKHADGRDEFHFIRSNRKAIYFEDPAGNILELIARYNVVDNASGPFDVQDIQYVNHVGLVVDEIMPSLNKIKVNLDMDIIDNPTLNFGKIGDEYRHLVLVTKNRYWLPEHIHPAQVYPLEVTMSGTKKQSFNLDNYPYQIYTEYK